MAKRLPAGLSCWETEGISSARECNSPPVFLIINLGEHAAEGSNRLSRIKVLFNLFDSLSICQSDLCSLVCNTLRYKHTGAHISQYRYFESMLFLAQHNRELCTGLFLHSYNITFLKCFPILLPSFLIPIIGVAWGRGERWVKERLTSWEAQREKHCQVHQVHVLYLKKKNALILYPHLKDLSERIFFTVLQQLTIL